MNRAESLERLADGPFDVLVIGGGATGLGVAVDAVTRGYRTALVEAEDFGKATSSRSTKLIHGGVRYLATGNVRLVREALRERSILLRNAPHAVRPLPLIVPAYGWYEIAWYGAGLKLYDLLAGRSTLPAARVLSRGATIERLPFIAAPGLRGGVRYYDGQFDDARLVISLARTAYERGAAVVNYVRAEHVHYRDGRACGAIVKDRESGEEFAIGARVVVNATGIFVDELRIVDRVDAQRLLRHSRGTHVVVRGHVLGGEDALLVPKTDDGRVVFAIPWLGHTLIGTTDLPVSKAELDPLPTEEEIEYLLAHANRYLARPLTRGDVSAAFAGLRPLIDRRASATARLSREHVVEVARSGLITVAGGKWTTYRKMAEEAVNAAIHMGGLPARPCVTTALPLYGADGADANELRALTEQDPSLGEPIHERLPFTRAHVVRAMRSEMARTVDDVLSRRTRASFLDAQAAREAAPIVSALMRDYAKRYSDPSMP